MNDLRVVLLLAGLCIIAGIYLWGTLQNRRQLRQRTLHERPASESLPGVRISGKPDHDTDFASALAGLSRSISSLRHSATDLDVVPLKTTASQPGTGVGQTDTGGKAATTVAGRQENHRDTAAGTQDAGVVRGPDSIIAFYIIPRGRDLLEGDAILQGLAEMNMSLGEMQIFHHYGIGEMKMDKPVFSLANMLEPGSFTMDEMRDFRTRGLVMFMCLPTAIDAELVFELMLNTAERLAAFLGADVCDISRSPINEQKIDAIRHSIKSA